MAGERALPGLGLKAFWTLGSNGYKPDLDQDLLTLSVVTQGRVLSFIATTPGSPTNGDIHIMSAGPEIANVAVRDNGAWVFLTPQAGWLFWNDADSLHYRFDGSSWSVLTTGGSGSWLTGAAVPDDVADGVDGDFYLRSNGDVYEKIAGTWGAVLFSLKGVAGTNGTNGTSFPAFGYSTKTANYVAVSGDFSGNKLIEMNVAGANTFTVNAGLTGIEPLAIAQMGAGQTTIVAGVGVTILTSQGMKLRSVDSMVTLVPCGTDRYRLSGDTTA